MKFSEVVLPYDYVRKVDSYEDEKTYLVGRYSPMLLMMALSQYAGDQDVWIRVCNQKNDTNTLALFLSDGDNDVVVAPIYEDEYDSTGLVLGEDTEPKETPEVKYPVGSIVVCPCYDYDGQLARVIDIEYEGCEVLLNCEIVAGEDVGICIYYNQDEIKTGVKE